MKIEFEDIVEVNELLHELDEYLSMYIGLRYAYTQKKIKIELGEIEGDLEECNMMMDHYHAKAKKLKNIGEKIRKQRDQDHSQDA